jgi:iron complex outermembrane receptor protein
VVGQSIAGQADKIFSAITPKLSAQYQWTPDVLQYVTWSKGFKSGGFDNRATRLDLATRPSRPRRRHLRDRPEDRAVRPPRPGQPGGLLQRLQGPAGQLQRPGLSGQFGRGNAGKAHTYGVELETDARATERLSLQASAGYLFAVYDKYKGAGGIGVNADGHRLLNSPRWSLSAASPTTCRSTSRARLRVGLNAQWQTKTYFNALQRPRTNALAQTS